MINWAALTFSLSVSVVAVGAATAYLRLFISEQVSGLEKSILSAVRSEFATENTVAMRVSELHRRLNTLEKSN